MPSIQHSTFKIYNYSLAAWLVSCALLIAAACWYPKWSKPVWEATISWDVSGYYWYLPAYLIYQDPVQMDFRDEILEKYKPSWDFYQAFPHGEGFVMKYPAGLALQYLPFFAVAHLWAGLSDYPADGFSFPYQAMIHWGSLLVAFWGLWLTRLNLRKYFRDEVVAIVLLCIGIGTNYFNYASIDAALTHNYLFTLIALLVWLTIRWHEKPTRGKSLAIGALVGLAALTRPTEIIVGLIPLLWGWDGFQNRMAKLWRLRGQLALAALATALVGSIQLLYWKSATGQWLVYSYQDQGFSFLSPHLSNVLFSYKKGWLVYTPLMSLALAGFAFLWKKKELCWPVLLFFLLNTWIVASWDIWWYGGSFGQRAMVQSYALLAFPLAALMAEKRLWPVWIPAVVFGIALNLFQTVQAHNGALDAENMNKAYYWHIFFNPEVTVEDQLILDSNERPFRRKEGKEQLFFRDFETPAHDSAQISRDTAWSGLHSLKIGPLEYSPAYSIPFDSALHPAGGLHLSGRFFGYKKEWDIWKMGQLHAAFLRQGETLRDNQVRVPRVMRSKEWVEIGADFHFPKEPFDEIRVYFANFSEVKTVYLDDLTLEVFSGR